LVSPLLFSLSYFRIQNSRQSRLAPIDPKDQIFQCKKYNSGEFLTHIGLFGGTFNPIHSGHVRVIREVKAGFGLDKILIIPSALPPHKELDGVVDAENRLEMIRLAFSDDPNFVISDVELKRSGPSYTIDTVRYFKSTSPKNSGLYLIVGLDAFLEIDTWKSYNELFLLIPFIVMSRNINKENSHRLVRKSLRNYLQSNISKRYTFSSAQSSFIHDHKQPVYVFNVTPVDISSTTIRKRIKEGRSIKHLVPDAVEDFIKVKGLYL
jgi:nicotinate-nucleotide adenylyltransferase